MESPSYRLTAPSPLGASYPVRLTIFEGPIDLLLHLIERQELDINEISLMAVTDQYLNSLERIEGVEPGALADFLLVASQLLYLKSRCLLPSPHPVHEEDSEDAGDTLILQLLEYRRYKQAASHLRQREEQGLRAYVRVAATPDVTRPHELEDMDVLFLQRALVRALRRIPSPALLPTVSAYPVTVAEKVEFIRRIVRDRLQTRPDPECAPWAVTFSALLSLAASRLEQIITFLAVLELIKLQELQAIQEETFGEIVLVSRDAAGALA